MKRRVGLAVIAGLLISATAWLFAGKPVQGYYGDMVLNSKAEQRGMPPVVFPHWIHRIEFKCKVCHPAIFQMKSGSNDIDMEKIVFKGEFCGKCHGKNATDKMAKNAPKIDMAEHGEKYVCWQCHYPHSPEVEQ